MLILSSFVGVFTGCTIDKYVQEIKEAMIKILNHANIKYEIIDNLCCGIPLIYSGFLRDAKKHALEISEKLAEYDYIVVECPSCLRAFLDFFPKFGIKIPPTKHFSQLLSELIKTEKLDIKGSNDLTVTYHDPCELGRHLKIFNEPREVIRSLGVNIKELHLNKEFTTCCGGGGLIRMSLPLLADEIAMEKIRKEVIPLGVKYIITACPTCYLHLKNACKNANADIEVYDLTLFVLRFLR